MAMDDLITPKNWDLDFFQPHELLGNRPDNQWAVRSAAQAANDLAKQFYEETGIRVGVNLEHSFDHKKEGTEGRRRGTRSSHDNPGVKDSRHTYGDAFDFQWQHLNDKQRERFLGIAMEKGFTGVGWYGPGGHIHLDRRPGTPKMWGQDKMDGWARKVGWNHDYGRSQTRPFAAPTGEVPLPSPAPKNRPVVPGPDINDLGAVQQVRPPSSEPLGRDRPDPLIRTHITTAARRMGVDPKALAGISYSESSWRQGTRAKTSSAMGIFGYTKGNFAYHIKRYGGQFPEIENWDRNNSHHQALLFAAFYKDQEERLKDVTGGAKPTVVDVYGAHHFGETGYRNLMKGLRENPKGYAKDYVSPAAVKANAYVFYNTKIVGGKRVPDFSSPKTTRQWAEWLRTRAENTAGWDSDDAVGKAASAPFAAKESMPNQAGDLISKVSSPVLIPGVDEKIIAEADKNRFLAEQRAAQLARTQLIDANVDDMDATEMPQGDGIQYPIPKDELRPTDKVRVEVKPAGGFGAPTPSAGGELVRDPETGQLKMSGGVGPSNIDSETAIGLSIKRREERLAEANKSPTAWQTLSSAFDTAWLSNHIAGQYGSHAAPDPDWNPPQGYYLKVLQDNNLPTKYGKVLAQAHSEGDMNHILDYVRSQHLSEKVLENAGWGGTAASFLAYGTDPIALSAYLGSAGLINPLAARAVQHSSRLASMASGAGAAYIAGQTILDPIDPHRNEWSSLQDAAFGAVIGGIFGPGAVGLGREAAELTAHRLAQRVEHLEATRVSNAEAIRAGEQNASVGAAASGTSDPLIAMGDRSWQDLMKTDFGGNISWMARARYDIQAKLTKLPSAANRIVSMIIRDPVGKKGGGVNPLSVDETRLQVIHTRRAQYEAAKKSAWESYAEDAGLSWWKNPSAYNEERALFKDMVSRYIREQDPAAARAFPEQVQQLGNEVRRIYQELHALQADPSKGLGGMRPVKGWDVFGPDQFYLNRKWSQSRIERFIREHGNQGADDFKTVIGEAIWAKQKGHLSREDAMKIGETFAEGRMSAALGLEDTFDRAIGGDTEAIFAIMKKSGKHTDQEINRMVAQIKKASGHSEDAGRAPQAKRRVLMDETTKFRTKTGEFSVQDFLENDIDDLFNSYLQGAATRHAFARFEVRNPHYDDMVKKGLLNPDIPEDAAREWFVKGITSEAEWDDFVEKVVKQNIEEGMSTKDIAETKRVMEFLWAHMNGRLEPIHGQAGAYVQMLRKFNFFRLMNQVGFAQFAEFGNLVNKAGYQAMFQQMPSFRRMTKDKQWVLRNGLDQELEYMVGVGAHELLNSSWARFDSFAGPTYAFERGTRLQKLDSALDAAQAWTAKMSGMNVITSMSQRWAAKAVAQRMANMATSGKALTESEKRLWRSLGIEPGAPTKYKVRTPEWNAEQEIKRIFKMGSMVEPNEVLKHTGSIGGRKALGKMKVAGGLVKNKKQQKRANKMAAEAKKRLEAELDSLSEADRALVEKHMKTINDEVTNNGSFLEWAVKEGTMMDRIADQMRAHASTEGGSFSPGTKIKLLNLEQWTDIEARDVFEKAIFRAGRQIVQENDIGMQAMWMSKPLAMLILQFRTFTMGAHANILIHNIHQVFGGGFDARRAMATSQMAIASAFMGGLGYNLQQIMKNAGDEERRGEAINKAFDPLHFAKSGVARASWSGIAPMVIDTAGVGAPLTAALSGHPQHLFDEFKGQSNPSSLLKNPTMGLADDLKYIATKTAEMARQGRKPSQQELKKMYSVVFPNFIPAVIGLDLALGEHGLDLDKKPPRRQ